MRLLKSKNSAQEALTALVNEGCRLLSSIESDCDDKRQNGTFNTEADNNKYEESIKQWANKEVIPALNSIFPTELEQNIFINRETSMRVVYRPDQRFGELRDFLFVHIQKLQGILKSLTEYTDLPLTRVFDGAVVRLYKFLESKWALTTIADRQLKISTFTDMNDPFELAGVKFTRSNCKIVPPEYQSHVEDLFRNGVLPSIRKQVGAVCLSRSWRNPVLWAHYAAKHEGIALGFDIEESGTLELHPVRYVEAKDEQDISSLLDEAFASKMEDRPMQMEPYVPVFQEILGIKFKDWAYEAAIRTLLRRLQNVIRHARI
jgi:hypothetical protein